MQGIDAVGLDISGVEAEANQVRADVPCMGCEVFWLQQWFVAEGEWIMGKVLELVG